MANTIKKADVLAVLNNLMGRRTSPGGDNSDLERYCQIAFDYAWRYYTWSFSLRPATITFASDAHMPADFDLDGYHRILATPGNEWAYLPVEEYYDTPTGNRTYTLVWDSVVSKYTFVTSFSVATVDIIYQVTPPVLDDVTPQPFPSASSIAMGAAVWAKQGENPTRADISQELDLWELELDMHTGRAEKHKPRQSARSRQEVAGTYTGDVGD